VNDGLFSLNAGLLNDVPNLQGLKLGFKVGRMENWKDQSFPWPRTTAQVMTKS